jgi:hypothetical protein
LVLALGLPALAAACLWDRDTLAMEAENFPSVIEVASGRFPRNPPLYYEMRLERRLEDLRHSLDDLEAYDDVAVALDRLGRSAQAIEWIERKRARLEQMPDDPRTKEHWYRYHANAGTFWAHRWMQEPHRDRRLDWLREGERHIARAIEINPDAHFGRERVQLGAMRWILRARDQAMPAHGAAFVTLLDYLQREMTLSSKEIVEGLTGLVVLGNAWESVDTFHALSHALGDERENSLGHFAGERQRELVSSGRQSLLGRRLADFKPMIEEEARVKHIEKEFLRLRQEADAWHESRQAYMLQLLGEGRHPDTDETFWAGWAEPAPPSIERGPVPRKGHGGWTTTAFSTTAVVVFTLAGVLALRRYRRQVLP